MTSVKFGTSGLRGLATDLLGAAARAHVWSFGAMLLERGLVARGNALCMARDFRDSSPALLGDVQAALRPLGLGVVDCGMVPTPALALYAMSGGMASIMVTGSHIPWDRNGIKFYLPAGEIGKVEEAAIAAGAAHWPGDDSWIDAPAQGDGGAASGQFAARWAALFGPASLKGLRVGVYQHSSVARDLLVDVLSNAGAEVTPLARSSTFIPVDTEAVSAGTLDLLRGWCGTGEFDAIVSADGDGDRPLLADHAGRVMRGDVLGLLTARYVGADVVVTPITSNSGLETALTAQVIRTQVGSPFVVAAMQQSRGKSVVGFEANGGFLCQSPLIAEGQTLAPLPTRDSFLPLLASLRLAVMRGVSLAKLEADLRLPVAYAGRLENFETARAKALLQHLQADASARSEFFAGVGAVVGINTLDGLRLTLDNDQIVHLRASGNAPELRCYVEAPSQPAAEALVDQVFKRVLGA